MSPRGRPALPRGVEAFDAPGHRPPEQAVLDTSFVVDALLVGQPRHPAAYRYLLLLAAVGTNVYFNRLLELELAEAAYKIAIKEQFGNKRARDMRTDGRALRRANRLVGRLMTAWSGLLNTFTWGVVEIHEIASEVPTLMGRASLPMTPYTPRRRSRLASSTL